MFNHRDYRGQGAGHMGDTDHRSRITWSHISYLKCSIWVFAFVVVGRGSPKEVRCRRLRDQEQLKQEHWGGSHDALNSPVWRFSATHIHLQHLYIHKGLRRADDGDPFSFDGMYEMCRNRLSNLFATKPLKQCQATHTWNMTNGSMLLTVPGIKHIVLLTCVLFISLSCSINCP